MLFNSYVFWLFFVIVLVAYRFAHHKGQNRLLLVASYVFYGFWDWRFLSLILLSTVVDYASAQRIASSEEPSGRRRWLWLSVGTNLGILGFFKYFDFFAVEFASLMSWLGIQTSITTLHVLLPVGISFYTFQTMSYTIDVYRGRVKPTDSFLDFALFVCFFPQLVAGPVERTENLMPQILQPRKKSESAFAEGLYFVLLGMFKKVVIADNMAPLVNTVFATDLDTLTGPECWIGVYAFSLQIYGDFSGYSSIAQGVAKWLDFDLMHNFRQPYFSTSPSDFWSRWHISLSQWLRDYLYIPLGGNRNGPWRTYRNLMLTMLLGGLWHGAGWTFIIWGGFHGLVLCCFRLFSGNRAWLPRVMRIVFMFHLVALGWLFFRASSVEQALAMMQLSVTEYTVTPLVRTGLGFLLFFGGPLFLFESWLEKNGDPLGLTKVHGVARSLVYTYVALMLLFFPPPTPQEFIYFQF